MQLSNLLTDLFDDLRGSDFLWQVGAIALCVLLGWAVTRFLRNRSVERALQDGAPPRIGVGSFARVLGALTILGLLVLAKFMLARYHQHVNLVRVALPLFASFALIRIAFYLLRRVFARSGPLGDALATFEKIFALLVWLGVALYITGIWPDILEFLETTTLQLGPSNRHKVTLAAILQALVSVVVLLMLALWAGAALEERLMGMRGVHSSLRVVMARMGRSLLIIVAILFSLNLVGIDLTVLSVFGGALGVGLGLGLQKIASNYVSGFVILLERSLSIGDMISVDKYSGIVSQINTRYTVLRGLDGVETVLPNEMLISGPVQNQTLSNSAVRVSTVLTVAYGTDLDVLFPKLLELAAEVPRVLADPGPHASLNKFVPEGFEIELGFFIGDPENGRGGVVSDVNKKIYALVQSGDIKLARPPLDPRILDAHIASAATKIAQTMAN